MLGEEVGDVVVHYEVKGAFRVIPVKVDARKLGAGIVLCDVIVLLENST